MIDYGLLLQIGGVAAAAAASFAVAKWRIKQAEERIAKAEKHLERLTEKFQTYQVEVAEKYVSVAMFGKFEAEFGKSIDRLTSRIDEALAARTKR